MDWKLLELREWIPLAGGIVSIAGGALTFRAGWWRIRLTAADDITAKTDKLRLLLKDEIADLERRHAKEMADLHAEYDRLLAENADYRKRLEWKDWRPGPDGPFSSPHVTGF